MLEKFKDVAYLSQYILRFAVPSDDDVPWLLKSTGDIKKVKLLLVEMAESKLFKLSAKAVSATALEAPKKDCPQKSTKTRYIQSLSINKCSFFCIAVPSEFGALCNANIASVQCTVSRSEAVCRVLQP
jgi:hypothetical protein